METYTEQWEYCGSPDTLGFYQFVRKGVRFSAVVKLKLESYESVQPRMPHIPPKERLVAMVEGFTDGEFIPLNQLPEGRWAKRANQSKKPKPKPYMGFRRLSHPPTKPGLYCHLMNGTMTTYMVTKCGIVTFINDQGTTGTGRIESTGRIENGFDHGNESTWYELTRDVCHDQLPDFSYSTWTQLDQCPGARGSEDKPGIYLFVNEDGRADPIRFAPVSNDKGWAYYHNITIAQNTAYLEIEKVKLWKGTWYAFDPAGALEMDELMRAQSSEVLDMSPLLGWHLTFEEVTFSKDQHPGPYLVIEPGQLPRQITVWYHAGQWWCWEAVETGKEQQRICNLPLGSRFFRLKIEETEHYDPSATPESGWDHALSVYRMGFRDAVRCLPEGMTDEYYKYGHETGRRVAEFNALGDDVMLKGMIQQRFSSVRKT